MTLLDQLRNEHRAVSDVLGLAEQVCVRFHSGVKPDLELLRAVARFLDDQVEGPHRAKETAVFRALAVEVVAAAPDAVRRLVTEHQGGARRAHTVSELVAVALGNPARVGGVMAQLEAVFRGLRIHTLMEETTAYGLAERSLDGAQWELLRPAFERADFLRPTLLEAAAQLLTLEEQRGDELLQEA